MTVSASTLLIGTRHPTYNRYLVLVLAICAFLVSFAAYAVGLFYHSGGIVLIPFHAALVGMVAGFSVGYARSGLVFAWLATYTSLLGSYADHAFFGLSSRTLAERFAAFVQPDGLVFLAVVGIVVGTLAFVVGMGVRWGIDALRRTLATSPT